MVHAQKKMDIGVYLTHPADRRHLHPNVASQQPTPTQRLSHPNGCLHPRIGQRAASSTQHRARVLTDPSDDQCPYIALLPSTQRMEMGRLVHSTSLPGDRPHLHLNVTSL
jgi:hypothetical protein